ncbi:MAG: TRAP transporter small permease [Gammaproteobacteria bacterium]|nr:TRAP transporter small permease [Gammaproteobacteria bacterium]
MSEKRSGLLHRLEQWGTAAENASLVILLGAMMILAVGQIVMRIFFNTGVVWGDELLKLMVLWMAMIASVAASRSDRHLRIDIISHFAPKKYARVPRLVVDAFAASICGVLAWQSWRFIQLSIEFEDTVLVGIPSWIAHSILPLAFALMCYRFFLSFIAESIGFLKTDSQ